MMNILCVTCVCYVANIMGRSSGAKVRTPGKVQKRAGSKSWARKERERQQKKMMKDFERELKARQEAERLVCSCVAVLLVW